MRSVASTSRVKINFQATVRVCSYRPKGLNKILSLIAVATYNQWFPVYLRKSIFIDAGIDTGWNKGKSFLSIIARDHTQSLLEKMDMTISKTSSWETPSILWLKYNRTQCDQILWPMLQSSRPKGQGKHWPSERCHPLVENLCVLPQMPGRACVGVDPERWPLDGYFSFTVQEVKISVTTQYVSAICIHNKFRLMILFDILCLPKREILPLFPALP